MDPIALGRSYFLATGLFVTVLKDGKPIYSSLSELLGYHTDGEWNSLPLQDSPCFCSASANSLFGLIHVKGTEFVCVLGPVFTLPLSDILL